MNPDLQPLPTAKRRHGRPKGSKNRPNAGTTGHPVGHPRKDGSVQVPRIALSDTGTGTESHNSDTTGSPELATPSTSGATHVRPALSGANNVQTSTASVNTDPLDQEVFPQPVVANNPGDHQNGVMNHSGQGASRKHPNPLQQYDEQLLCDYNEDEDDDVFDSIDAKVEYMCNEFAPLVNDDDNVLQGATVPTSPENIKVKIPRSTMPTWLHDEYVDAHTRLQSEIAKTRRPACYENGQFTMTTPPLVFSRVVPYEIEPIDFYWPHFFMWLPHLLQQIPCPECKDAKQHTKQGQPVMLCVLGWPQQPRHVIDIEHLVFIIGHRYHCGHEECKRTFQSWSPAIITCCWHPAHIFSEENWTLTIRKLHVAYLETVRQQMQASASGLLPSSHPFPQWNDPNGYAGYVPSHRYFRAFYDSLIELHAAEMDQHMAMQSAEGLSHDHSYKVTGILGKVNSVATFGALHTACNNYGECRKMTLTPMKGHDDCMPALAEIPVTLAKYGHAPVKVIFTDNVRGDKSALEQAFPSLLHDVSPVPSSTLDELALPDGWHVHTYICHLGTTFQINNRMNCLMDELHGVDDNGELFVAMDLKWPVDQETGIYGKVSLISFAYGKAVYLIPCVHKIGVQVKGDLTHLYNDCGFSNSDGLPFADHACVSLSDLTGLVLRRYLPKDPSVCDSTRWDDPELSSEQETYAALDVYAAWAIYEAFSTIPSIGPVTPSTSASTQIQLMSHVGGLIVAYGYIACHQPKQFDQVNVSKTRVVVTITSITVPGYLVQAELLSSHQETSLSTLGTQLPFSMLCCQRDLCTCAGHNQVPDACQAPLPPYNPIETPYHMSELDTAQAVDMGEASLMTEDQLDTILLEQAASDAEKDPHALQQAESLAEVVSRAVSIENSEIRSRIIGDIWHLMDQFKISLHHGLQRPFSHALRDAIFLLDPEDCAAVKKVLEMKNTTFQQMVLTNSDWVWQHVRRLIPPPETLAPRVAEVLQIYGPLKDAVTGQPLFNDLSWEKARTVIENIKMGYYSDPPGYSFYALLRMDKHGLGVYRQAYVGTMNHTGKPYLGSHDIWTHNWIAHLIDITTDVVEPSYQDSGLATWLNGDDFEPARESFGILPFTPVTRTKLGMSPYQVDYAKGCKIKHDYLAGQQQTLVAVLPVHTVEEKALYWLLIKNNMGQFSGKKQPNWITLAIFYKLPEHLKSYFKTWNEHQNEHNSVEQNKSAYNELQKLLTIPVGMPEITLAQCVILGRSSSWQTLLQLQYNGPAPAGPQGQKRPAEESVAQIHVKQRTQRTCKQCHKADCPRKFKSRPCKYKPSNGGGQWSLDSLQHDTLCSPACPSAPQYSNTPGTGLSAPFSVQNVACTKNGFISGWAYGTVRSSMSAQASTSRLADSPPNLANIVTGPQNHVDGGEQDGISTFPIIHDFISRAWHI
ncbi:hypothetical protein BDR06DRAFT_970603 [Suillus hirtellus]|nr:hypothetical protein BDR06DRAFT_970603 [Suillus hirtellus]